MLPLVDDGTLLIAVVRSISTMKAPTQQNVLIEDGISRVMQIHSIASEKLALTGNGAARFHMHICLCRA